MKNVTLLSGSLIFYAYGETKYLPLLMISILANHFFGLHIGRRERYRAERGADTGQKSGIRTNRNKINRRRKAVFAIAILYNVGMLAAFKYVMCGNYHDQGNSVYSFPMRTLLGEG